MTSNLRAIMKKFNIKKEWLTEAYKTKTQQEIADILGCSTTLIHKKCKELNLTKPKRADKNRKDLTGSNVGMLTIIEYQYTIKKIAYWLCRCQCGKQKIINGKHLKTKKVKSCGCILNQQSKYRTGFKDIPGSYISSLKRMAAKRNLEFSVTPEDLWNKLETQQHRCALSGIPISFPKNQNKAFRSIKTASLDRIDSNEGYTLKNIQWVHKHINAMKQDLSDKEFIEFCIAVVHWNNALDTKN